MPELVSLAGIELHRLSPEGGMDLAVLAGAYWVRYNAIFWSEIEPTEGERNWQAIQWLEKQIIEASDAGFQLIIIVRSAPAWARQFPNSACGPIKPEKYEAFGRFMFDLVSRYSVAPYNVLFWEIGNEPDIDVGLVAGDNIFGCMGDKNDPYYGGGAYAQMLKAIYPQVKAANNSAQMLTGGLLLSCDPYDPPEFPTGSGQLADCSPGRFLEGILQAGGGNYFDGVSFHAYDYYDGPFLYGNGGWHSSSQTTGPTLINKTRFLRGLLAAYGHIDKFLMNTEVALLCGSSGEEAHCQTDDFIFTKSYYLAQVYAAAQAEGLKGNIWYSITGWRASGLVGPNMTPNRGYYAYQYAAQQLAQAIYEGEINNIPGLKGYKFQKNGADFWLVWSIDGDEHTLLLPGAPATLRDVLGTDLPISGGNEVTIGVAPVYVIFPDA